MKNNFYKPTPEKFRKLGDSFLGISASITGYAIYSDNDTLAISSLIFGVLGKFLSDFFTEENG